MDKLQQLNAATRKYTENNQWLSLFIKSHIALSIGT